ncbi:amiloride-sensitive sodium channel subunit beta-like isoform X2 [Argiope bruennichi]|uniref:amiloride-sensitive sodium channel subunit beta-like isoform X2 n=1 Tax=Argiope bruennichi TaxID=94029 RepID=UPI002494F3C3|nr:amiloride-sensitive sodium channel subunit beta-like isoform X2 [Argiope bruennichi]
MKQNFGKRVFKKKILRKKNGEFISRRPKRESEQLNLLGDFIANRLSAAGVSHAVKAPSPLRRAFWLLIVLLMGMGMAYMTYRVLQEYLAYPTVMRSKIFAVKDLEFPAVTVCSLNLVPKLFAKEAGLEYMEELERVLDSLPLYNISSIEKTRCLKDPLCYWSWFADECFCSKNPCETLYCYPDLNKSDEVCACSMLLCQWNGTSDACLIAQDHTGGVQCLCKYSFEYPLHRSPPERKPCEGPCNTIEQPELREAIDSLQTSADASVLLKRLKASTTDDVRDMERFYIPGVDVTNNYGMPYDNLILSCSYGPEPCRDIVTLYSPTYGKCYMFNYVGDSNDKDTPVKIAKQPGRMHGLQLYLQARKQDTLPLLSKDLGVRIVVHDPRSIPIASENGIDIRPRDMASISLEYLEINRLGQPWGICAADGQVLPNNYSGNPYIQSECESFCINEEIFRRCHCYHPRYLSAVVAPRPKIICATNDSNSVDRCFLSVVHDTDNGTVECNCPPACSFSLMGVQIFYNSFFISHVNETAIYSWESLIANIGGNMGLFLGLSLVTIVEVFEFVVDLVKKLIAPKNKDAFKSKINVENF